MPGYCQPSLAGLVQLRVQRLHLAESGKSEDWRGVQAAPIQLGASCISRQHGSSTAAAKADFSISITAGLTEVLLHPVDL